MFVDFDTGNSGKINNGARSHHPIGHRTYFSVGHSGVENRHTEGGHLVIRDVAASVTVQQELKFLRSEFLPIPLAMNQVDSTHFSNFKRNIPSREVLNFLVFRSTYRPCRKPRTDAR